MKKRIRLVAAAAGMSGLALLASGCITEAAYTGNATGEKVAILGDQTTYQSVAEYHAELDADFQVRISGWAHKTFDEFDVEKAAAFDGDNPKVAVIDLGTEDILTGTGDHATEAATMAAIERMYDRFPTACTVGVTVNEHMTAPDRDLVLAAQINTAIRNRAYHIVEWSDVANAHPEYFTDGGIVPTPAGQAVLASLVHEAATACLDPGGA